MNVKKILAWVMYGILPILTVVSLEMFKREGIGEVFTWILEKPSRFIVSYLIVIFLQTIFFIFSKNIYIVCISSITFFSLWLVIDSNKMKILNEPLLPWDLFFVKQLINLLPVIYKELNILFILISIIVLVILIVMIAKRLDKVTIGIKKRLAIVLVSIVSVVLIGFYKENFVGNMLSKNGIAVLEWDQKLNQQLNGVVLGFMLNIPSVLIDKPDNYSKSTVQDFKKSLDSERVAIEKKSVKPNIIIVMSEAFWDIGNLSEQIAKENYIPNVQKLKVGNIASPQFGGGTANVEFEALTGLSMNLLPAGSIAYQQYVKRPTPSLASILANEGYESIAIHSYFKWFWDRENVYKNLGFQKFTSVTEMPDAKNKGMYVGDDEITKQIVKELESNENPIFIYAVTMQNHGSYNDNRYGDATIQVPGNYEEETKNSLNTYATGIADADKELGNLVHYLEASNEPSIVVFFGDHLPLLGANYKSYAETGYIPDLNNWSLEDHLKMKETPLVVWDNFGKQIEQIGSISPSFIGPTILNIANIQQPDLFKFLQTFSNHLPVYTSIVKRDIDGKLFANTPEKYIDLEEKYKLLQYDTLFGNQYIYTYK